MPKTKLPKGAHVLGDDRIQYKGRITVWHDKRHGYPFTMISLSEGAYEWTEQYARAQNDHYSDRDYLQYVGQVETGYSREVMVEFQHYTPAPEHADPDGEQQYCRPRYEITGDGIPMGLMRELDKLGVHVTADRLIAHFVKLGWVLTKTETRTIAKADGQSYTDTHFRVRDLQGEVNALAYVEKIDAARAERRAQEDREWAMRRAEREREASKQEA